MQRILEDHKIGIEGTLNAGIQVMSTSQPGTGGAHRDYVIQLPDGTAFTVQFHDGAQSDANGELANVNGTSFEALLVIIIDRLQCFQAGEFACEENATALEHVDAALQALHARTRRIMQLKP